MDCLRGSCSGDQMDCLKAACSDSLKGFSRVAYWAVQRGLRWAAYWDASTMRDSLTVVCWDVRMGCLRVVGSVDVMDFLWPQSLSDEIGQKNNVMM